MGAAGSDGGAALGLPAAGPLANGLGTQHSARGAASLLCHLPYPCGQDPFGIAREKPFMFALCSCRRRGTTKTMTRKAGTADLPLHGGRVPAWLANRMARLGAVMTEAIVHHYGRDEFLRRVANPFWFQSFGAVMGMDWHSSGITTSVLGALKRGLKPLQNELGLTVCGGRGRHSRATPAELIAVGERTGLDGAALAHTSRLVAKVDSAAVQDGFQLYLHGFIVAADGKWTVVQQGMNDATARRYHWLH